MRRIPIGLALFIAACSSSGGGGFPFTGGDDGGGGGDCQTESCPASASTTYRVCVTPGQTKVTYELGTNFCICDTSQPQSAACAQCAMQVTSYCQPRTTTGCHTMNCVAPSTKSYLVCSSGTTLTFSFGGQSCTYEAQNPPSAASIACAQSVSAYCMM